MRTQWLFATGNNSCIRAHNIWVNLPLGLLDWPCLFPSSVIDGPDMVVSLTNLSNLNLNKREDLPISQISKALNNRHLACRGCSK